MTNMPLYPHVASSARAIGPNDGCIVVVASDTQLRTIAYASRLAIAALAENLSRRKFADRLADVIYGFEGQIVWPNGSSFEITDTLIDDVFGDDQDFRWLSDFLKWAGQPPRQRPQEKILPRLRVIDLYFRIKYPARAQLIAK